MAELTQTVIDIVEKQRGWDADLRQNFYLTWLENPEDKYEFEDEGHLKNFVNQWYSNLLKNKGTVDARRTVLRDENADTIVRNTAPDRGEDPADILSAAEEVGERVASLSPLLYDTLTAIVVDGITAEAISEADGVSVNTVYQRLWEAKKIVKGE